ITRELLLDDQPMRKSTEQSGEPPEPNEPSTGEVGNMGNAADGQQMVWAHRVVAKVRDQDEAGVFGRIRLLAERLCGRRAVAVKEVYLPGLGDAFWRLLKLRKREVEVSSAQKFADGVRHPATVGRTLQPPR